MLLVSPICMVFWNGLVYLGLYVYGQFHKDPKQEPTSRFFPTH